ncbi:insulinase family protein [Rickettsiales endosymbiont of Peranema trichophorum]|uniref:M16 family metallopeptidase n=1 Tax=Rickettsiales endosymbiont of Peranema trichophorum TaxID=2486577 RepID=UPI00102302AA|nr:pitrilysin family protein [Rickettsiales endosymbiont of Peranema trichophorum]RZI47598.1 insulinase family protein [Rickettsiales endosymbiont of Peranema trichophorum]
MPNLNFISLPNQITIAHDSMTEIESASISVLVKTGSRFEDESICGISHLLEHMAFKGTKTRSAQQIAEEFDMIGGHFNAYTSREKTVYYTKVLKDDIQTATDILADIIQNSVLAEEELEKEKRVVLQEIAQTEDTPDDIVFDHFQSAAFPDQPLGRSILGTPDIITNMSRDTILNYIDEQYKASNIIIAAAGNIKAEEYKALMSDKFSSLSVGYKKEPMKSNYIGGETRVHKDLEQIHIICGFKGLSYYDNDSIDRSYYTQQILAIIAGGGMSSRLFQEVREKRGLAYTIYAFSTHYSDTGIFGVYSNTHPHHINELIDVVSAELQNMSYKITEEELVRAKAQLKASLLMARESSLSRAEKLASNLAKYGRNIPTEELLKEIDAVNVEAVRSLLNVILSSNDKPTISSIGKNEKLYQYDIIVGKFKL